MGIKLLKTFPQKCILSVEDMSALYNHMPNKINTLTSWIAMTNTIWHLGKPGVLLGHGTAARGMAGADGADIAARREKA